MLVGCVALFIWAAVVLKSIGATDLKVSDGWGMGYELQKLQQISCELHTSQRSYVV